MLEHGQRRQAQEVELDQARLLDVLHVELGGRHQRARVAVERHQLVQRPVADHHAGGMGRGVARQAFELQRDVDHARHPGIVVARLLEPRLQLDRLRQGHRVGRVVRHELADPVDQPERQAEHAADVAQGGARLERAEGDDLRHPVGAVAVADVGDHLVAPVLAEVDVEVRHRHALGVEEALEQQAEAQRVEVGDVQAPGDDRAGARAAPRPDRHAVGLGPLDEVGDDQEVARELHLRDDVELVGQPLAVGPRRALARRIVHARLPDDLGEPALQTLGRLPPHLGFLVLRRRSAGSARAPAP